MKKNKSKINRRDFIKYGGLAGTAVSLLGAAGAGFHAGSNTDSYTGWERYTHGDGQFFDRKPFEKDEPTYKKVGETRRIHALENIFIRNGEVFREMYGKKEGEEAWKPEMGMEALPERLRKYYEDHPGSFDEFIETLKAGKQQRKNWEKFKKKYAIADAWSEANSSSMMGDWGSFPPKPKGTPEEWDFKGVNPEKMVFKSPKHASELIKMISHTFGATLVGIAKINPDWVYQGYLRGVGKVDYDVPKHWKNAIIVATPHEWDSLYANPTYGTSYDAYSRERIIAGKLEVFLKHLGYSARSHVPGMSYELAVVPLAIDAGLGELGRCTTLISPELGANTRLAAISTDLDMESDKPIDIGVDEFCKKCKICAESCPSGAISFDDEPKQVIRGYKRWHLDHDKCFKIWNSVAASHPRGCRVCIAVCPYSRKNNWLHTIARELDPRDPTGLVASGLLAMQKGFFTYPEANEFLPPPDGENKVYHEPPKWLKSENWFEM